MMTPKSEKWLERVTFWALTLSVGSYSLAFFIFHTKLTTIPNAFAGRSAFQALSLGFALTGIWFMATLRRSKLKALMALLLLWFGADVCLAFYSIPGFEVVFAIGIALEAAALVVLARFAETRGHQ